MQYPGPHNLLPFANFCSVKQNSSAEVSSSHERDRQAHTEDVYHDTDEHHLEGERTLRGGRQGDHDNLHEEIDRHSIERTEKIDVLHEEVNPASQQDVNASCAERNEKVQAKAE